MLKFMSEEQNDWDLYISHMITIRRRALENIQAVQERQKGYYDAKHGKDKSKYQVGAGQKQQETITKGVKDGT